MVTENEQIVEVTPEPQSEVQVETATQEPVAETTEQPVAEDTAQVTNQPEAAQPQPETVQQGEPVQTQEPVAEPSRMANLQQTIAQQQQQLQYLADVDAQNKAQQQAIAYQKQLEEQGWMPDQAQTVAQNYVSQMQQSQQQQQQLKQQQEFRDGQRNASMFFAKKYGLGFDDMPSLEKHGTPQDMETEAKRIQELRQTKAELDALKKAQVQPQQFDTNQPAASASGSEDELLDQYNSGVRNSQTEAAARRAAGLG
jgi:hypothetical protein